MSKQKTIVADTPETLDNLVGEFTRQKGVQVFATHTDWKIEWNKDIKEFIQLHKVTLFYKEVTESQISQEKKNEKEIGAGWVSKFNSDQLSVKLKDSGAYVNIDESDLKDIDGDLFYTNPKTNIVTRFEKVNSSNPKAPKYRIFSNSGVKENDAI